jgi:hypothetical protein
MAYQLHIKQDENLREVRSTQTLTDKQQERKRLKAAQWRSAAQIIYLTANWQIFYTP